MKKIFIKILNSIFDKIIFNFIFISYYSFVKKFISPRIQKIHGIISVKGIQNKGKDLRIHGKIDIVGGDDLKIGDFVRIGMGCYFDCVGGLTIGDNVQFSRYITIYTNTHDIESSAIPYDDRSYIYKPVIIGNSVWIGTNVIIAPGTIIEDGAVIGMGAVVAGRIPKGAIVVGAKHRIIGYRNIESFDEKVDQKKYFGYLYPDW